jgi:hypothetical protein
LGDIRGGFIEPNENSLSNALIGMMDRTFLSDLLPEPVKQRLRMWDVASKRVYMELMMCELEGYGTWWRAHTVSGEGERSPRSTRKTDARHSFFPPCTWDSGFKQKSVIEFTNAAKIHFLERFLLPDAKPSCSL